MRNKKGGLPDAFFLIVAFFAIAFVYILMNVVISNVNTEFQDSSSITPFAKDISSDLSGKYVNLFDKLFLFIVVGLGFAVLAGAFFISSHPALFMISSPILAFAIFIGAMFANIYGAFKLNDQIATHTTNFLYINFIFDHFVPIITVYVLLLAITLYAKRVPQ